MSKKVFVSSTSNDLHGYRLAAIEVINRYKCIPLAMELFGAQPQESTEVCDKEVEECDIFIGVYAYRFGYCPNNDTKSITQQEFELAQKLGKPCLCFIVNKEHPWKPEFIEFDKQKNLQDFLAEVRKRPVDFFTTVNDFSTKLATSLGNQLNNRQTEEKRPAGKTVPIAPTPFLAHPYPLQKNFTGRQAEKSLLGNWFHNGEEPLLVLEAIGGMGKSALSWVWLHEEILETGTELDGVLWWSFYDAPFDSFLPALFYYATSKEVKIDRRAHIFGDDLDRLISIILNNRFLLILDGFERALRGYNDMNAMYRQEDGLDRGEQQADWDQRQREPVHPQAAKFLQALCQGHSKTLLTTRLLPTPLSDLAGVQHAHLPGLSASDAVRFLRREGVTGARHELEQAAAVYNNHPLLLKQLATALQRSRGRDIRDAYKLKLIDRGQPHKILSTSFNLLDATEKRVATTVAVLRATFSFDTACGLFPDMEADTLWQRLRELHAMGFLFYDSHSDCFDFHPVMRAFLYDSLTARAEVHARAVSYFEALPKPEKVATLADLTPVIELYHHLVRAGKFDEARELFRDRINQQTYYQLAAYNLRIELLKELFPDGTDQPPRLSDESAQAWTLNSLANSYSLSGQPAPAVPLFLLDIKIMERSKDKLNIAIPLGNVAYMAQLYIGQLAAAAAHVRKSVALGRELDDAFWEAVGHQNLGRVLAYPGRTKNAKNFTKAQSFSKVQTGGATAEDELAKAFELFEKDNNVQSLSVVSAHRSLTALLSARLAQTLRPADKAGQSTEALQQAAQALAFAEKYAKTSYPLPRDFIDAYRLLGEALMQCHAFNLSAKIEAQDIHFYDQPFQQVTETLTIAKGDLLPAAERCLDEALRRCRTVNMVSFEADILLAHARLLRAKTASAESTATLSELATLLHEAHEIAARAGYRLQLADIHLFCAELLLDLRGTATVETQNLASLQDFASLPGGLSIHEHLQKAKEYAKDVSEFEHLYPSQDPHFYDGIAEYDMLKRGMSEQERIDNGYWVAYRIAEELEGRL